MKEYTYTREKEYTYTKKNENATTKRLGCKRCGFYAHYPSYTDDSKSDYMYVIVMKYICPFCHSPLRYYGK